MSRVFSFVDVLEYLLAEVIGVPVTVFCSGLSRTLLSLWCLIIAWNESTGKLKGLAYFSLLPMEPLLYRYRKLFCYNIWKERERGGTPSPGTDMGLYSVPATYSGSPSTDAVS